MDLTLAEKSYPQQLLDPRLPSNRQLFPLHGKQPVRLTLPSRMPVRRPSKLQLWCHPFHIEIKLKCSDWSRCQAWMDHYLQSSCRIHSKNIQLHWQHIDCVQLLQKKKQKSIHNSTKSTRNRSLLYLRRRPTMEWTKLMAKRRFRQSGMMLLSNFELPYWIAIPNTATKIEKRKTFGETWAIPKSTLRRQAAHKHHVRVIVYAAKRGERRMMQQFWSEKKTMWAIHPNSFPNIGHIIRDQIQFSHFLIKRIHSFYFEI